MIRRLKRVLRDEQNEVLHNLRRRRRPVSVLPGATEQPAPYRDAASPLLRHAAREGARFVATLVAGAKGPDAGADAVDDSVEELVAELVTPLRERLERALSEEVDGSDDAGDDDTGDDDGLVERLSATYRGWKPTVEEVSRHYVLVAFGRGAFAAVPDGTELRWVVDDEGRCPDCEDNALAGPTAKGQPYPTGQPHPPAHPGCRCVLAPA
jgi:hypothetical protein